MKNSTLFVLWGGMFILCAGLGFIPDPQGGLRIFLTLLSVAFFVPPVLLVYRGDDRTRALVRGLAAASLGLTLVSLIANFLTVMAGQTLGTVLYYILVIVSSPMVCSGYWALSLFLWACLFFAGGKKANRRR